MRTIVLLLAIIATLTTATAEINEKSYTLKPVEIAEPYTDIIIGIYADSPDFTIVETANWKFLYIENIKEINYQTGEDISEFQNHEIIVKELKQIGNNAAIAKIMLI